MKKLYYIDLYNVVLKEENEIDKRNSNNPFDKQPKIYYPISKREIEIKTINLLFIW